MSLTYRPTTLDDLISYSGKLRHVYGHDPDVLARLPQVWRLLLDGGSLIAATVEDRLRPPDRRVVALGASVFVTDRFMAEAKNSLPPYLGGQIVHAILQRRSPVLSADEARQANTREGLNLCILHERYVDAPLGDLPEYRLKEKIVEAYFYLHRGCRLKEFLQEVYGTTYCQWMQTSGMKLRSDYARWYDHRPDAADRAGHRPYLLGLTRQEAQAEPGTRSYQMFLDLMPRFGFSAGQQELLRHALAGETDEQLADSLCLSTSAVKKRWFALYDRVADADPELLAAGADPAGESRRGAERRRHLLNYLREHPEELWPINAAGRHPGEP